MKTIAKITIIISLLFNIFLFVIYFLALSNKIQNPEYKNLPFKEYMYIGIGLIVFAIINTIFVKKIFKKSSNI